MSDTTDLGSMRDQLHELVDLVSEDECVHVFALFSSVARGDRFWEHDMGRLYNEYVKARYFDLSRNMSSLIPAGPVYEDQPFAPIPLVKEYPGVEQLALPKPEESPRSLTEVIRTRRSQRDFKAEPLTMEQLSGLLHFGAGATGFASGYGYHRWPLRSFPSSGGLQAPEVYVAVRHVAGLEPGLYHYQPVPHSLELLAAGDHGPLLSAIGIGQPYISRAPVVFVLTGFYARINWKYGERSFRYMCMDTGFVGENLSLTAEALGLGACAIAGFIDDALERMLGVDAHDEVALLMLAVGVPEASTHPSDGPE